MRYFYDASFLHTLTLRADAYATLMMLFRYAAPRATYARCCLMP